MTNRYGELYLLSSPFSNPIGCYRIVEGIAAAEMGLNLEQFVNILSSLQASGIAVYESGYILVRTWFLHNTWESTLQGNVAKIAVHNVAEMPMALREKWVLASIEAGVPEEALKPFLTKPLASPSVGASKGLQYKNDNKNIEHQQETTTTTEQILANENASGGSGKDCSAIFLTPLAEHHRAFIESALRDLSPDDAQMLADEVGGTLEAAAKGKRKAIDGLHGWLPKVVTHFHENKFTPQWGPAVAKCREENLRKAKQEVENTYLQQCALEKQVSATAKAKSFISDLSSDDLQEFASLAETFAPMGVAKKRIRESVLQREIPLGIGKAAILQAMMEWAQIKRICQ